MNFMPELETTPIIPEIHGLACVYIPVWDVYESTLWYQRNLGLTANIPNPIEPGITHSILVYPSKGPAGFLIKSHERKTNVFLDKDGYEMGSFCFAVTNIEQMYRRLVENGVRVEAEVVDRGGCGSNFRFYDPDGNKFDVNEAR
jgi:predicted enzyme related to lactoylglutathione lyase